MKTLKSDDVFYYDWSEEERQASIGQVFASGRLSDTVYFPVGLSNKQHNYGVKQGLLYVSQFTKRNGVGSFAVGACSPDDLDCDLYFEGRALGDLRQRVIEHLKKMPKHSVTYLGVLKEIQQAMKTGTIST